MMTRSTSPKILARSIALAGVALATGGGHGASWFETPKLVAADGVANDQYGAAVAIADTTAVVGAQFDDDGATDTGSVYVYEFNGVTWTAQPKINASDAGMDDNFGASVAIDDDVLVVGAPGDDADAGAIYIYRRVAGVWGSEVKLIGSDTAAGDTLGASVAINGDTIIAGAPDHNGNVGVAYVFRWNGAAWLEDDDLNPSDGVANDRFGLDVAIDDQSEVWVIVGARHHSTSRGAAYVYTDSGGWSEDEKLEASDPADFDQFGTAVAFSGDWALVGARNKTVGADALAGRVYAFENTGTVWNETMIDASDEAAGDNFGEAIAMKGGTAVVGAPQRDTPFNSAGAAYILRYSGAAWNEEQTIVASDAALSDEFGLAVGFGSEAVIVGAPMDILRNGGAHVFNHTFLVGEAAGDRYGHTMANAGDVNNDGVDDIVVGAPYNSGQRGRAYVHSGTTGQVLYTRSGQRGGDRFGWSVAAAGDVNKDGFDDFLVGAPRYKNKRGRVYVYSGKNGNRLHRITGEEKGDEFGYAVAGGVDVNDDNRDDFFAGAPRNDENGGSSGKVYAFSGKNGDLLNEETGENNGDRFGFSLAALAKADGDDFGDLAVGAPRNDDEGKKAGKVYVCSGKDFDLLYTLEGKRAGDQFGYSLAAIGRANGDNRTDFAVGSPFYDKGGKSNAGRVGVYSGKNGDRLFSRTGAAQNDRLGWAVGGGNDVDGDGRGDVVMGAPRYDGVGGDAGRVYVRSGRNGGSIMVLDGFAAGDRFGSAAGTLGDKDGDGQDEILVGAPTSDLNGSNAGHVASRRSGLGYFLSARWVDDSEDGAVADDGPHTEMGDLDGNGIVNGTDVALLLDAWGAGGGPADLTGDGVVDDADLREILELL